MSDNTLISVAEDSPTDAQTCRRLALIQRTSRSQESGSLVATLHALLAGVSAGSRRRAGSHAILCSRARRASASRHTHAPNLLAHLAGGL